MNDDELVEALGQAMRDQTAEDLPAAALVRTLAATSVGTSRPPYLVPLSAAAAVAAISTGGVLLAQTIGSPARPGTADPAASVQPAVRPSTTSAAPATTAVPASPSVGAPTVTVAPPPAPTTTMVGTAPTSVAPVTTAAAPPTTTVAPPPAAATTTGAAITTPPPTTTPPPAGTLAPMDGSDDRALLAGAASLSVDAVTVVDPTLPDTTTTRKVEVFSHDGNRDTFFAGATAITWDELATLPTGTEAFRAAIKAPGHPPNAVEKGLQELYLEGPLPIQQRQAAFAVAQSMPGAAVTQNTQDQDGRPATRVRVITGNNEDDYYFDPVSFRLLETASAPTAAGVADYNAHRGDMPAIGLGSGYATSYSDWTIVRKTP
jgi:hypothetical protein